MTTPVIGEGEKLITAVLLNGERLHVKVHTNANGQALFDQIVKYTGIKEVTYFGLMIIKDGEHQFLDLEERLSKLAKYAPHLWKDDGSCNSSLVFTIFFRVKYYVENICLLEEQATRHQYYLQLRKDVLENNIRVHDDTAMVLASYALQAEMGDYDKVVHGIDYFVPQHYLPPKTIAKLTVPYIKSALPAMHQSHRGLSEPQSEIEFLKEAQKLSEYGILFHRVYKKEYNKKIPYSLGICVRGLIVYEDTGTVRNPVCKHPWNKIKKMSFKRRKFLIDADTSNPAHSTLVLYTANYKRSRYLLKMCSSFYNFQMMMATKLARFQDLSEPPPSLNTIPTVRIDAERTMIEAPDGMGRRPTIFKDQMNGNVPKDGTRPGQQLPPQQHQQQPKPAPKPMIKQYTVDLRKVDGSFGFSIVGGIELGGIFVKELTRGGSAAQCGQITAGDRIVQVNKVSFENVTRREAINTLRNSPEKSRFTFETFGQTLTVEADASILTPLTLSASSIATLGMSSIPPPTGEKESEYIRVELPRKDGSFGISFTGGPELGGIYVKSLMPGGVAEANGRVAVGDRLIELNGQNVEGCTRKQIQDLLKTTANLITLVLERYKQIPLSDVVHYVDPEKVLKSNPSFQSVTLCKKNDSLGFSITGGLDLGGIFIKSLNMNGPAAVDGRIEIGDRIVAINNVSLETATRAKALEVIRNAVSPVRIILEKCVPPERILQQVQSDQPLFRSESVHSLPTQAGNIRAERLAAVPRGMTLSMQDIPQSAMYAPVSQVQFDQDYRDGGHGYHHPLGPSMVGPSQHSMTPTPRQLQQEVFVVDLPKVNGSFGISITGGPELGGIFVKAIQPGGSADQDGRIAKGDRIVEINGRRIDGYSKTEVVEMLKTSNIMATLILERLTNQRRLSQMLSFDGDYVTVDLQRKGGSFGLCLTGGPELRGIYIKNLLNGGAAQVDGRIGKGDRLVEINGISLEGFSRQQANEILKKSPSIINLVIERLRSPEEVPPLDGDLFTIDLPRGENGYGLSLTGGPEIGGIYVKGILPGGAADANGRLRKGDRLIEINGVSLEGTTRQQASDLLKRSSGYVNMLIERFGIFDGIVVPESEFFTIELMKRNNNFGINLTGGPEIDGIYIKSLQAGGAADLDGRIQRGDRVVAINGLPMERYTRQQATEMLKGCPSSAILQLERCVIGNDVPPLDSVLTVVELSKGNSGFGLSLMGGPESGGIFVRGIMPGGAAEADNRIQIGDKVVEINGVNLEGCSKAQATELLKTSPQSATFVLERYKLSSKAQTPLMQQRGLPGTTGKKVSIVPIPVTTQTIGPPPRPALPVGYLNAQLSVPGPVSSQSSNQQAINYQPSISQPQGMRSSSPVGLRRLEERTGTPQVSSQPSSPKRTMAKKLSLPEDLSTQAAMQVFQDGYGTMQSPMKQQRSISIGGVSPLLQPGSSSTLPVPRKASHTGAPPTPMEPQPPPQRSRSGSLTVPGQSLLAGTSSPDPRQDRGYVSGQHSSTLPRYQSAGLASVTSQNGTPVKSLPYSTSYQNMQSDSYAYNSSGQRSISSGKGDSYDLMGNTLSDQQYTQRERELMHTGGHQGVTSHVYGGMPHQTSHLHSSSRSMSSPYLAGPSLTNTTRAGTLQQMCPASLSSQSGYASSGSLGSHTPGTTPRQITGSQQMSSSYAQSIPPPPYTGSQMHVPPPYTTNQSLQSASTTPYQYGGNLSQSSGISTVTSLTDGGPPSRKPSGPFPDNSLHGQYPQGQVRHLPLSTSSPRSFPGYGGDYIFEVILYKTSVGLGLNLSGGGDEGPVVIKRIAPGLAADECGQLEVGDHLLEVNGKNIERLLAREVISILRASPYEVQLLVKRPTVSYQSVNSASSSYIGL